MKRSALSASFGAFTAPGAGAALARNVDGEPVELAGVIEVASGDGTGWTISNGRLVRQGARPDVAVLRCALAQGGEADVSIQVDPWTYDIASTEEMLAAQADMVSRGSEAGASSAAWVWRIRDGSVIVEPEGEDRLRLFYGSTQAVGWLDGAVEWPNRGVLHDADYDYAAQARFSGGHLTIQAETPLGAEIRAPLFLNEINKLALSGLRFTHTAQPEDGAFFNVSLVNLGVESPTDQLHQLCLGNGSMRFGDQAIIVERCKFGGRGVEYDAGGAVADHHFQSALQNGVGEVFVQDNEFHGFRFGVQFSAKSPMQVATRNIFRDRIIDCVQGGSLDADSVNRLEVTANLDVDLNLNPNFAGDHMDFTQRGTDGEQGGMEYFIARNISDATTDRQEGHFRDGTPSGAYRGAQGILTIPRYARPERGLITRNFLTAVGQHGISIDAPSPDMEISYNTVIMPTNLAQRSSGDAGAWLLVNDGTRGRNMGNDVPDISFPRVHGNLCGALVIDPVRGYTARNLALTDNPNDPVYYKQAGALSNRFNGPFTFVPGQGDTYSFRKDSYENAWADLTAIFTPRSGGGAEQAGFTAPAALLDVTPPTLLSLAPSDGAEIENFSGFSLTFDRPVVPGPGSIRLHRASDDALVEIILADQGRLGFRNVEFLGDSILCLPSAPLTVGETYYVIVESGALLSAESMVPFAGVTQPDDWRMTATASALFDPAQLFVGARVGVIYDPSDISTLWKDVGGTQPVTSDGDLVARIDDKSGSGRHATMGNAAERPIYRTYGNRRWLDLPGTRHIAIPSLGASRRWEAVVNYEPGSEAAATLFAVNQYVFFGVANGGSTSKTQANHAAMVKAYADGRPISPVTQAQIASELAAGRVVSFVVDTDLTSTWSSGSLIFGKYPVAGSSPEGRFFGCVMIDKALSFDSRPRVAQWLIQRSA